MEWISVKDRPLFTKDEKGRWTATEDGDKDFIAAVPYYENGKGYKWWIRHCVLEDVTGLCVVADAYNDPAGWHHEDIEYWMPLPSPPVLVDK